ncbi:hypothetical protein [Paludisphaera sp.]|uniref:hypothetical protein n=1 Tax=Paludisphaera sp. TaxID=2017432 RepID=UPI00301DD335
MPDAPGAVATVDRKDVPETAHAAAVAPPVELPNVPVEPVATPMLDAALRRAEAAEEARREAIREAEAAASRAPEPAVQPDPAPPPAEIAPPTMAPPADEPAPKVDPAVRTASDPVEVEVEDEETDEEGAEAPPLASAPAEQSTAPPSPPAPTADPEPIPQPPDAVALAVAAPPINKEGADDELTIDTVQLCRKIVDFGNYEPLRDRTLRPGRSALIYCELGGLEYRQEGGEFVARVATRVELIRPADGAKVWEVADSAIDRRPARRRDVYVGTMVTLPDSIAPGDYTLRLYQADATSGGTASTELAVTIAR